MSVPDDSHRFSPPINYERPNDFEAASNRRRVDNGSTLDRSLPRRSVRNIFRCFGRKSGTWWMLLVPRCLPSWQIDVERRSPAQCFLEANLAAKPFDNLLSYIKTQSGPALFTRLGSLGLCELLEDVRLKPFGDARTVVPHRNSKCVSYLGSFHRYQNLSISWREFDRIGEKICNELSEPVWIGVDLGIDRSIIIKANIHAKAFGEAAIGFDGLLCGKPQINPRKLERDAPRFDFFHIENVVDQANQPLAVRVGDPHQLLLAFRHRLGHLTRQKAERSGDGRQWCAQFVTHRRDEIFLQTLQAFALADVNNCGQYQEDLLACVNWVQANFDRKL